LRRGRQGQANLTDEVLLRILLSAPVSGHSVVRRLLAEQSASHAYAARSTYLGLHRLERKGLLAPDWRPVSGRSVHAKYYRVTAAGARHLRPTSAVSRSVPDFDPVALMVVIAVIGSGDTFEAHARTRRPHVTIIVDPRVPVSSDELRRASIDVNRILGAIGVTTDRELEQPELSATKSDTHCCRRPRTQAWESCKLNGISRRWIRPTITSSDSRRNRVH
jgi:hypothetical protein